MKWPWVYRRRLEAKQRKLDAALATVRDLRKALELSQEALDETKQIVSRVEQERDDLATRRQRKLGSDIRKMAEQAAIQTFRESGGKKRVN